ncbi:MAG: lysophospholipid acyltransferase family protein [Bacteroidota bacterium]
MKNVLSRIWSIWFYILFLLFFILIFPLHVIFLLIPTKWAHDVSHYLNFIWGCVILYPTGVWVKSVNRKKIKRGGTYIFAPNHSSYLDIPICNVSILNAFRFIGKAELNSIPLFGYMFKRLHISVNRGSVTDSYRSFVRAKDKLKEGTSVLIYPEGTIPDKTKTTLLRFKDGAFRLAIENGIPIVPMTILGADRVFPDDNTWKLYPGLVRVIFHDPIETKDMDVSEAPALKERVFNLIYETIKENGYEVQPQ